MSAAQRLDAADGVIDGRFYGRPIVQAGAPAFGGVQTFGAPAFGGFGGASAAQRLDAADGVMDGRFHGRPIVQAGAPAFGGVQTFGAPAFGGVQTFGAPAFGDVQTFGAPTGYFPQAGFAAGSQAAALDAADGVIDGRFHGRPIVQAGGPQFATRGFAAPVQTFGAPAFGQTFGGVQSFGGVQTFGAPAGYFPQGGFVGGVSSTAAALDAADGVIDGRHFGRPIVQGTSTFVQNPPIIAPPTAGYAPAFGQTFGGVQTFGAPVGFGGASAAARLDAADGVMDGRHFGRPIVRA